MDAFNFYCSGSGAGFYYVFNAVAALFNGADGFNGVVGNVLFVILSGSMATAVYAYVSTLNPNVWFGRVFVTSAAFMFIFVPKTNLIVTDYLTDDEFVVANVPWALAAPVSAASQVGRTLALRYESFFRGPAHTRVSSASETSLTDKLNFSKSGVGMASKVAERASTFRITDPDMATNMKEFVHSCVLADGLPHRRYTMSQLINSKDIWTLLSEKSTPWLGFPWIDPAQTGAAKIVNCQEGARLFSEKWPQMIEDAQDYYGGQLFPGSEAPQAKMQEMIKVSYDHLMGMATEASSIFRQQMMKNALRDGVVGANGQIDSTAGLMSYATTRAKQTQENAWRTMGSIGAETLTFFNIVIELLVYSLFPVVAILSVLPNGLTVFFKRYILITVWLQSWPILYSVLNMIINIYAKSESMKAISAVGGKGLTLATMGHLGDANSSVAAVASGMIPLIPWISLGIFTGGAKVLSGLSQTMMHQQLSAAQTAGDEITMGRMSLAEASGENFRYHNNNSFKQDTGSSIRDQGMSFQNADGSTVTHYPNSAVHNRGEAISHIGSDIRWGQGLSRTFGHSADEQHRQGVSDTVSMQENLMSAWQKHQGSTHRTGHGNSIDDSSGFNESSADNQAWRKTDDMITRFAEQERVSKDDAAKALFGAHAGFKAGTPTPIKKIFGASAGINLSADSSRTVTAGELMEKATQFSDQNGFSNSLDHTIQHYAGKAYKTSNDQRDETSDGINANFSEALSRQESAQAHLSKEQAYRKMASLSESETANLTHNLNQEFVDDLYAKGETTDSVDEILRNSDLKNEKANAFLDSRKDLMMQKYHAETPTSEQAVKLDHENEVLKMSKKQVEKRGEDNILKAIHEKNAGNFNQDEFDVGKQNSKEQVALDKGLVTSEHNQFKQNKEGQNKQISKDMDNLSNSKKMTAAKGLIPDFLTKSK